MEAIDLDSAWQLYCAKKGSGKVKTDLANQRYLNYGVAEPMLSMQPMQPLQHLVYYQKKKLSVLFLESFATLTSRSLRVAELFLRNQL